MKKNILLYTLVGLICTGFGAYAGIRNAPDPEPAVAKLLAQSMNDAAGKPHKLADWEGKIVLVNFWAPWCGPCVKEMPELSALAAEMAAKNIHVIGIGIDTPSNIAEFATKYKISYPLFVAGMSGTDLARELGNKQGGLPYTVLIGADGKVIKTYLGGLKFEQLKADLALANQR